jgi:hypothetical protein
VGQAVSFVSLCWNGEYDQRWKYIRGCSVLVCRTANLEKGEGRDTLLYTGKSYFPWIFDELTFILSHKNDTCNPQQTRRSPSSARDAKYPKRRQKEISVRRRKQQMVLGDLTRNISLSSSSAVRRKQHVCWIW